MKKFRYYFFSFLFPFIINAQPTITSNINPAIGDVYNFTSIKDTVIMHNPGPSGNGVAWYFDGFRDSSAFDFTYSDTTGKPFNSRVFPRSNLAMKEAGSAASGKFAFYHQDINRYAQNADLFFLGGNYFVVPYDEYLDLLRFPLTFGQTFTNQDTADWILNLFGSTAMRRYVTSTTIYDGYGTLQFKAGSVLNNISRIHIFQTIKDTVNQNGALPVVANTVRDIYMWFNNVNKKPIMYWQKESTSSNLANLVTYKVLIDNVVLGIADNKTNAQIKIFPNPASDKIYVTSDKQSIQSYMLIDEKGSIVASGNLIQGEKLIDISTLSKGVYFIKIGDSSDKGIKFVKE